MSWIKDVKNELSALDVSAKSLKRFGLMIGGIFLLLGILFHWKNTLVNLRIIFDVIGILLLMFALINPKFLRTTYKVWMGFAFALGWLVSRFILIILFYIVLLPIGIIAKIFGKKFLDTNFRDGKSSYWIIKENKKINYEKLY